MVFSSWFGASDTQATADRLFAAIVEQARQPAFYTGGQVADTVDGRFDMIVLHLVLVLRRLKGAPHKALGQRVFDTFFGNMDDSLREMGVGDLAVPKRIQTMSEAVYGRIDAYEKGFAAGEAALAAALTRNVYRDEGQTRPEAQTLARYMHAQDARLSEMDDAALLAARAVFGTAPSFTAATPAARAGDAV